MDSIYTLSGFKDYYFKDKILYRKQYITKSISCKFQYRSERIINKINNNGIEGYILVKKGKRKFYSFKSLKHKLICE